MQRPFCEKGVPESWMRMDISCSSCSKRDRECKEYKEHKEKRSVEWTWAYSETLSPDSSHSICAHCGQRPAGDHKDGAGERVCNICAGVAQETAPKNNAQEGKPRMSLIPLDVLEKYLVPAYEEGVQKYSRESWRGGFHTSVLVDAALRHITDFYFRRQEVDPDSPTGKHHLAGALFSIISILNTLDTRPELDDRPGYQGGGNNV